MFLGFTVWNIEIIGCALKNTNMFSALQGVAVKFPELFLLQAYLCT
jgi:hypothetical protein